MTINFASALPSYYKNAHNANCTDPLVFSDNKWKTESAEVLKRDSSAAIFENTRRKIVQMDPSEVDIKQLTFWIQTFNNSMSLSLYQNKKIKPVEKSAEQVDFSSMNDYRWLSNFFPTIIYDPMHRMIYPSVESGYVAFKARRAKMSDEEIKAFAQNTDPKDVKQQGNGIWKRTTDQDNQDVIAEMKRLVTLKFEQNAFIERWLIESFVPLNEFTNDAFWGNAMGTALGKDSNHLGRIMAEVREELLERKYASPVSSASSSPSRLPSKSIQNTSPPRKLLKSGSYVEKN